MTWFTEADVEAAARAICWAEIGGGRVSAASDVTTVLYVNANWHRNVYQARAALAAIPDPRAAGFEAAIQEAIAYHRDAAAGLRFDHAAAAGVGTWVADSGGTLLHYADLHDGHAAAIAALKPEDKP